MPLLLILSVYAFAMRSKSNSVANKVAIDNEPQAQEPPPQQPEPQREQLQPSLVIVASINAGTSSINALLLWKFKDTFHGFKDLFDGYYWTDCVPRDCTNFGIKQAPNPSVNFDNLSLRATEWKSWNYHFSRLRWRGWRHACSQQQYMQWIGYDLSDGNTWPHVLINEQQYQQRRETDERWPDDADYQSSTYYWERASGYNGPPYVAVLLAVNFPDTKLLYIVRDPLLQMYSRIRHFDEHSFLQKENKNNMTATEANRRFGTLLQFLKGDEFSIVFDLLQSEHSDHNEDEIVMWYFTQFARRGIRWKDERYFDICPVINILLFVRSQLHFNSHVRNVGLLQFEQMASGSTGFIHSAVWLRCWMTNEKATAQRECYSKYTRDEYSELDEIMFGWSEFQKNPHYGKLSDYQTVLSDVATMDAILDVFKVCDERLLAVIKKYPILLGDFDMDLWSTQRQEFRQKVVAN